MTLRIIRLSKEWKNATFGIMILLWLSLVCNVTVLLAIKSIMLVMSVVMLSILEPENDL
jgi:hypothetical protein